MLVVSVLSGRRFAILGHGLLRTASLAALRRASTSAPETILPAVANDEEQHQDDEGNPRFKDDVDDIPSVGDLLVGKNPPSEDHNPEHTAQGVEDGGNKVEDGRLEASGE